MSAIKGRRDFTEGPIFWRITAFALPIMLTGLLQVAYGMADNMVVGKFSGDPNALAAVGCTGPLTNLVINLLLGLAGGTGVAVAQIYGAKDDKTLSRVVHTAMVTSLLGGVVFMLIGLMVSRPALMLMETKPELIDLSVLYVRIIFVGIPVNAIYNFGAAILRATGDSRSPLIILSATGLVNVALNIVFVVGFNMSVSGVAIATVVSQLLSAVSVVAVLMKKKGMPYRFQFSRLCFETRLFGLIARYGVPSGLQSAMFAISNILLVSAVNSFPTTTVTANTIAGNIDALTYIAMNSFSHAAMTFTGQNFGAVKPKRIKRSILYCLVQVVTIGALVSGIEYIFMEPLIGLYLDKADPTYHTVMQTAKGLVAMLLAAYILCGIMDTMSGAVKGMGYALAPMAVSVGCICGLRIFWIYAVFPHAPFNTIIGLYLSYPVSWSAALVGMTVIAFFALRKAKALSNKKALSKEAEAIQN